MGAIDFTDYDRITDTVYPFNNNLVLNFTVSLARQDKSGGRMFFHYETEYPSKYHGVDNARSIKRIMNFYYTIDNKNDFGNGIILRLSDVYSLILGLRTTVIPWFIGSGRVFSIIENKLVVNKEYKPFVFTQSEYKWLTMEPIVIQFEDSSYKEGVRMTVNSRDEYVDMDVDRLLGFFYLLKNTDMYSVACNMVTYAKMEPYGINIFKPNVGLGGGGKIEDKFDYEPIKTQSTKGNGFLDKLGGGQKK